ncbi:hypothetical protein L4D20_05765 [Vibrio kyushuensis]|uniref:hypothetical protein n=1 Tax=Vibrio kyushuensis TaxID=2910249 RepID=UPI003D0C67A3
MKLVAIIGLYSLISGRVLMNQSRTWMKILLCIDIAYLIAELGFNAALLNVTGYLVTTDSALDSIETTGRTLSGIGLGLLIVNFLALKQRSISARLLIMFSITSVTVPFMFWAQSTLIDNVIIANASDEQRAKATKSVFFQELLAVAELADEGRFPYSTANPDSPMSLTFVSAFPILFKDTPQFESILTNELDYLVSTWADGQAKLQGRNAHQRYLELYDDMMTGFNETNQAVKAFNKKTTDHANTAQREVDSHWSQIITNARSLQTASLDRAMTKMDQYIRKEIYPGRQLYSWLHHYFNECKADWCFKHYHDYVTSHLIETFEPIGLVDAPIKHWCRKGNCPVDRETIKGMIRDYVINNGSFYKKAGFGPLGKTPDDQFIVSVAKKAVYDKKRIYIDEFDGTRSGLKKAVYDAVFEQADQYRPHQLPEQPLSLKAFINRHDELSKKPYLWLKKHSIIELAKIESGYNAGPIMAKRKRILSTMPASMGPNEEGYELGNDSLKRLIVPPVALFLSLAFGCLALIRIPMKFMELRRATDKPRHYWHTAMQRSIIAVALVSPFWLMPNIMTAEKSVAYFATLNAKPSPLMVWYLNTQPIIYPVGQFILDISNYDNRDPYWAK